MTACSRCGFRTAQSRCQGRCLTCASPGFRQSRKTVLREYVTPPGPVRYAPVGPVGPLYERIAEGRLFDVMWNGAIAK